MKKNLPSVCTLRAKIMRTKPWYWTSHPSMRKCLCACIQLFRQPTDINVEPSICRPTCQPISFINFHFSFESKKKREKISWHKAALIKRSEKGATQQAYKLSQPLNNVHFVATINRQTLCTHQNYFRSSILDTQVFAGKSERKWNTN